MIFLFTGRPLNFLLKNRGINKLSNKDCQVTPDWCDEITALKREVKNITTSYTMKLVQARISNLEQNLTCRI